MDPKEIFLFVPEEFFVSGFTINEIRPIPLIAAKIIEIKVKLNSLNDIARIGTQRFAIKNAIPPIRPLFSTIVISEKRDKKEGMLKPKEVPKRIDITRT